jgi:hypothetical protein
VRRLVISSLVLGMTLGLAACQPIENPGRTDKIEFVSTSTLNGWRYDYFRNIAYPCSISGYQTFVIGTKLGSSSAAGRPLWVYMHGGGVGFFHANGQPGGGTSYKIEEPAARLINPVNDRGLTTNVRADAAAFRLLSVSMCDHDIYGGGDQPDPNNPNTLPDGGARTVNGLFATKAAIQYARANYPTTKTFLHGTSAGGYGSFSVAWALEKQGVPAAGFVADAGVLNQPWEQAQVDQNLCPEAGRDQEALDAVNARIHPAITDPNNQPHFLIKRGDLKTPVMLVWSRRDSHTCGDTPMQCPLPDGTRPTLGSTDCRQEPVRREIAAEGANSRSRSLRLCVSPPEDPGSCSKHTPTADSLLNTDPGEAADYNATIMAWVRQRLAD